MAAWWETVLSVGAGGAFAMGGQWLQAHLSTRSQREARSEERGAAALARRHAYELDQLHELRLQLPKLINPLDMIAEGYADGHLDPAEQSPALVAEIRNAIDETERQTTLLLDQNVRTAVKQLTKLAAEIAAGSAYDTPKVTQLMLTANDAIGIRVRVIYGPDPTKVREEE